MDLENASRDDRSTIKSLWDDFGRGCENAIRMSAKVNGLRQQHLNGRQDINEAVAKRERTLKTCQKAKVRYDRSCQQFQSDRIKVDRTRSTLQRYAKRLEVARAEYHDRCCAVEKAEHVLTVIEKDLEHLQERTDQYLKFLAIHMKITIEETAKYGESGVSTIMPPVGMISGLNPLIRNRRLMDETENKHRNITSLKEAVPRTSSRARDRSNFKTTYEYICCSCFDNDSCCEADTCLCVGSASFCTACPCEQCKNGQLADNRDKPAVMKRMTTDQRGFGLYALIDYRPSQRIMWIELEPRSRNDPGEKKASDPLYIADFMYDETVFRIVNDARWANHSCEPNSRVQRIDDPAGKGTSLALIAGDKGVNVGDEITFDYSGGHYKSPDQVSGIKCRCGSQSCRGQI